MNFIEYYGCKKNDGLEDLEYLSYRHDVLSFKNNMPLDYYYDDVIEFYQHYEKEINDILNCKDDKDRFDSVCRFLKEKSTFEYLLNNADKEYNGEHCHIHLWNIEILIQKKYLEKFHVSLHELYFNYCSLIDKISGGAFDNFGYDDMSNDDGGDMSWEREKVVGIFMLPNGWIVCECDDYYVDDSVFCEYLYYDKSLLYVGNLYESHSDIVESFFEFQNTEDFKKHETEKNVKIQEKYKKNSIVITDLNEVDFDNLVLLYKRQIADIRNNIYKSKCQWIQRCCETISIIAQRLWKIDRNKIKLMNSIERDLCISKDAKKQLSKELEKVFGVELDEKKFMDTNTIKDVFELVVYTIEKLEKRNIQLQDFS